MGSERDHAWIESLVRDLDEARSAFLAALDDVDPALLLTPGLVGEWSARELLAHLGYWTGHAAEALHRAELNQTESFGDDELTVDARNAVVARVAASSDMAVVRQREAASYEALREQLQRADPAWLEEQVAYGDTLEQVVRDDGADHYREHAADIRAWFSGADEPDAEDGE